MLGLRGVWAALLLGVVALACRSEMDSRSDREQVDAVEHEFVRIGGIDWHTDYDEALQRARELRKPLWVHFGENPG